MNFIIAAAIAAGAAIACSEKSDSGAVLEKWPWEDQTQEPVAPEVKDPNQAYVEAGWMNVSEQFGELPAHINVYKAPSELEGKSAVAYIAVADMAKADWDVWSVKADNTYKTELELMNDLGLPVIGIIPDCDVLQRSTGSCRLLPRNRADERRHNLRSGYL